MTAGGRDHAPPELIEFLAKYDPGIHPLVLRLRRIVLDAIDPCHECVCQMRSKVVVLYGATARVIGDGICQMAIFRHDLTLVFPDGIDLDDPTRVLRGTGRTMRHVRVTTERSRSS